MTIGEKILNMRKARGWSQEELAERIGVTRQAVSRWESGAAKPDTDKVIAVCDLFGISADYLLRDLPQAQEQEEPASGQKKSPVSPWRWLPVGSVALGLVLLLVLRLVYIAKNTNYYYSDTFGKGYSGYEAFLRTEELLMFDCLAWGCLAAGCLWLGLRAFAWLKKKWEKKEFRREDG